MKGTFRNLTLTLACLALTSPMFLQAKNTKPLPERVRHELAMLPYYNVFDDLGFRVDNSGVVTLYGDVTNPVLKADASRTVQHVEGVTQVVNNINVLPLSPMDWQIRRAAYRSIFGYSSMYRYAMGAMPSIHIIVANGHVKLEGVVTSEADKNIAGIRANSIPGVFAVENNLQVAKS